MNVPFHFVVPGPLDQATGGYRYVGRIVAALRNHGRTVIVHELPGRFPACDAIARDSARSTLEHIPVDEAAIIDGLALPAFYDLLPARAKRVVALIHHPLGRETGLPPDAARDWLAREMTALGKVDGIIVTSRSTADDLRSIGLVRSDLAVVPPGTDRARASSRHARGLLCVASLTPRKGHVDLLMALSGLKRHRWRLDCIGSAERDVAHARRVRRFIRAFALGRRVRLLGEVDDGALAYAYRRAGLFVLASRHEGYGMAFAEALAHGLPIVGYRAAAVKATVSCGAGRLVSPGDRRGLRRALRRLMVPTVQAHCAKMARRAARRLSDWRTSADELAAAVDRVVRR